MAVSSEADEKSVGVLLKVVDFDSPAFQAEVESLKLPLRGRLLTAAIAFVTGTGFTLFGCVCSYVRCDYSWINLILDMTKGSCRLCLQLNKCEVSDAVHSICCLYRPHNLTILSSLRKPSLKLWLITLTETTLHCRACWSQYTFVENSFISWIIAMKCLLYIGDRLSCWGIVQPVGRRSPR